jgi:hypothetical protein
VTGASAVAMAIRDGRLRPAAEETCRACGDKASSWHHPSYAEGMQLVVVPVCTRCHSRIHHAQIPDPATGNLWCKVCRSSMGCTTEHAENEKPARDLPGVTSKVGMNVPVEPERLERWRLDSKRAGYSTLAEYVRHVLDGRIQVVALSEPPAPPATKGRGRPKKVSE